MSSARYIDVATLRADGSGIHIHPPEVAATVMVRRIAGGRADIVVLGPRTAAVYDRTEPDVPPCAVARIRPGRLRGLLGGLSAADLVDRVVPLTELWGTRGAELARELGAMQADPSAVILRLHDALADGLDDDFSRYRELLDHAHHALAEAGGQANMAVLSRSLGISERHLRTVFTTEIGLSPKLFARLLRVRRVADLVRDGGLARLAGAAGYYDQAHMTTEFRRVMGVPPGAYAAGRFPPPRVCRRPARGVAR
ncbi:helix-turn-helix domain-containing protein [Nocardia carnea]|uniref:Helix-turn-helix domain-containing protein n=1 Tax=Nocardia carnea TaxID=37328 RepID=A0ABW7TQ58_9NOCA|nr:helix-turn-helix domain-containing protein [Nocardia carnea]